MAVVERLERRPILAATILLIIAFSAVAVMLQSGTGLAETCPTGTPTPSGSGTPNPLPTLPSLTPSATPSGTPTPTSTPTPSDTPTPSATPTPTGSSSASPLPTISLSPSLPGPAHAPRGVAPGGEDPTPTPDPCSTSLSLNLTPSAGVWGTQFTPGGTLTCAGGGIAAQTIMLKKQQYGSSTWQEVGTDTTDSEGVFTFAAQQPAANTAYKAFFAGSALCDAAQSGGVTAGVRPGVAFNVAANGQPDPGEYVTFAGKVSPSHVGHRVVLQVLQGGQWTNAVAVRLNSTSQYRVSYKRNGTGMLLFRMAYPSQHGDHLWNISRRIAVTWS